MIRMTKREHTLLNIDEPIPAPVAQRKVTRFVILEIGDHLYGGDPEEAHDQEGRTYWSVSVMLAIPREAGRKVGNILVDAATGQLQVRENTIAEITAEAERLAEDCVTA